MVCDGLRSHFPSFPRLIFISVGISVRHFRTNLIMAPLLQITWEKMVTGGFQQDTKLTKQQPTSSCSRYSQCSLQLEGKTGFQGLQLIWLSEAS